MLLAVGGLGLAWASAARWLPDALTNQPAYLALAAVSVAALVGYGLRDARPGGGGAGPPLLGAGDASVRYVLTDRDGISALDIGREGHGPGYAFLDEVVREIVVGQTRHGGALLGALGGRLLVPR